jgi:hypothetical protein
VRIVPGVHEHQRARGVVATVLVVVGSLSLVVALLVGWTQRTVFDDREFADRVVAMLDSSAVRRELAGEIATEVIAHGSSSLASYRTELGGIVEDVLATEAFRGIFRNAVEQAHRAVFQRNSGAAVLELGETLELVSENASSSGTSLASQLPTTAGSLLVDVAPTVRRIDAWRFTTDAELLDAVSLALAAICFGAALALVRRRWVFELLGVGIAAAGVIVVIVAEIVPDVAASTVHDAAVASAVRAGVTRFVADLRTLGLWTIPCGVVIVAAAGATQREPRHRIAALVDWLRSRRLDAMSRPAQLGVGAAAVVAGVLVIVYRHRIVPLVLLLAGALVVYLGTVLVIRVLLGPQTEPVPTARARVIRPVLLTVAGGIGVIVLAAVFVLNVLDSGSHARERGRLVCNGHADLCDRRLDEVAFAGSHNSMSAEADPGWLFAENIYGVPAQLEYGMRALLIKSHYGIPTGISLAGTPLVVTDRSAEIAGEGPDVEAEELGPEQVATVQRIDATAGQVEGPKELYLCHGYCELGATRFSEVLGAVRSFIARNPNEVVIIVIGDFITPQDTARAFREARLLRRIWTYDTDRRPPTLRRMIEAGRPLLVLSEHAGGTPAWYGPAYLTANAIFQDTPYTFAKASDFSCAPNRGRPDSPLFQINHWITTTSPPSPKQAFSINSYERLMARVRECERERGRFPTIVGVNFYDHGDVLGVVDELNRRPRRS